MQTMPSLTPGQRLGPYTVTARLGAGGMGEVYRARDGTLGREVAIKILPMIWLADPTRRARFEREARILAALNHPNIAQIYGVEQLPDGGSSIDALVLELVEGQTLANRIARSPLPVKDAVAVAQQIADALDAAHEKGIVHRDLKPANIILAPDGRVKVLDFGLAKAIDDTPELELTQSPTVTIGEGTEPGMLLGTAAYMSPEQARGQAVDKRTDIWAFGCVLYEMLTGRAVFAGATPSDTIAKILEREPDWTTLPTTTPPGLRLLLGRCLEKDVKHRLRDIGDVPLALEHALASDQIAASRGRRGRLAARVVAAVIAAVAAVGAVAMWYAGLKAPARSPGQPFRFSINPPPGAQFFRAPNRGGIALSQDGSALVFTAVRDGQMRLWLQRLDASVARELTSTEGAHLPFWSPDARSVAFFAGGYLKRVDLDGGRVQILADAARAQGGTWNRDGTVLFAPGGVEGLFRVPATGGQRVQVTSVGADRGETGHVGPIFLPDGRHFIYMISSARPEIDGVYVGSLADPTLKVRIAKTESWAQPAEEAGREYLLWVRDGSLVAQRWDFQSLQASGEPAPIGGPVGTMGATPQLAASRSGVLISGPPVLLQLRWVDRSGGSFKELGESAGLLSGPVLSPDLEKVAVVRNSSGGVGGEGGELLVFDLARAVSSKLATGVDVGALAWSPDSSAVAYGLRRQRSQGVALRRIDGIGPETLPAPGDGQQRPVGWSHGELVYYQTDPAGPRTETALFNMRNGQAHRAFILNARMSTARLSEDGRWIAYSSDDSGRAEVYIQRFEPEVSDQRRWQASSAGGSFPRWRRDGRELFYATQDGQLMAVSVDLHADTPQLLQPRVLFPLPTIYNSSYSYDVAPDGQRFLVVAPSSVQEETSLSVVMNWPAAIQSAR